MSDVAAGGHVFKTLKGRLTWPVCSRCGMVLFKHRSARQRAKKACKGL